MANANDLDDATTATRVRSDAPTMDDVAEVGDTLPADDSASGASSDPRRVPALAVVDAARYAERTLLSRGGMGRILTARDVRLGRRVALKELEDDHPDARARFAREALLTARLEHPSIVAVHEAGCWPDGEPFYAMRLVPGRSFDKVIAAATTLEQRLALVPHVLAVAEALAYAHRERVIHRDLKPHNVMIGEFGETVVIDWGLAKDLDAASSSPTGPRAPAAADAGATVAGEILGTPAYMPPEQAEGRVADERADVYAIGAILYHLLTGAPPFVGKTGLEALEALRHGAPAPVVERAPDTPRELRAILDRAMARDVGARYPTARELADDLRRFQTGQLVGAHRYTLGELTRRWIRRHRGVVAIGGLALATLLVVGVTSVVWIVRAEGRAQDQRRLAERHRADAEELMYFMLTDLRQRLLTLGRLDVLDEAAQKAADYYASRDAPSTAQDLRNRIDALQNLGDVLLEQGKPAEARIQYLRELALIEPLLRRDPGPTNRRMLAHVQLSLAEVARAQGDAVTALAGGRAARDLLLVLVAEDPADWRSALDLATAEARTGDVLLSQGDLDGALAGYRAAVAIWERFPADAPGTRPRDEATSPVPLARRELFIGQVKLGDVLIHRGDATAAAAAYQAGLEIAEARAAAAPADAIRQRDLAVATSKVGDARLGAGDTAGALTAFARSLEATRALAARDPLSADRQRDLSIAYDRVADVRLALGDDAAALDELRAALDVRTRIAALDETHAERQRDLSISHGRIGDVLVVRGDLAGALDAYREARRLTEALVAREPSNLLWQEDLATCHAQVGDTLDARHDRAGARLAYQAALAILTQLTTHDPSNPDWREQRDAVEAALTACCAAP